MASTNTFLFGNSLGVIKAHGNEYGYIPDSPMDEVRYLHGTGNGSSDYDHTVINLLHLEESYFPSVVHRMIRKNNTIHENKLKLYKVIAESSRDNTLILEGFADYQVQADAITYEFLNFIRAKVDDFCNEMDNFIKSDKEIEEHKEELLHKIKMYQDDSREGYMYRFDPSIPNLQALTNFNASLFDDLMKGSISGDLSVENISNVLSHIDLEQDYRKFRAEMLGLTNSELSENEYAKELRRVYRSNNDTTVEIDVDVESIKAIADKWFHPVEYYYKPIKEHLGTLVNVVEVIMKKISTICKHNNGLTLSAVTNLLPGDVQVEKVDGKAIDFEGMRMSGDMMVQLDMFCKLKLDQLQKYTDIACMALMAKMDAMKDSIRQNHILLLDCVEVLTHPNNYYNALGNNEEAIKDPEDNAKTIQDLIKGSDK